MPRQVREGERVTVRMRFADYRSLMSQRYGVVMLPTDDGAYELYGEMHGVAHSWVHAVDLTQGLMPPGARVEVVP